MAMIVVAGQRFGMLEVLMDWPLGPRGYRLCRCDCGNGSLTPLGDLRSGNARSCGCQVRERTIERNVRHGMTRCPEYVIWQSMLCRCLSPRWGVEKYIKRGICDRWNPAKGGSFENFYVDMGPRPSPRHTIERYDNSGPYAPWNCGWELKRVQDRNKSNNRWVTYNGERMILADAADLAGVSRGTVKSRMRYGWPESDWFIPPSKGRPNAANARATLPTRLAKRVPARIIET